MQASHTKTLLIWIALGIAVLVPIVLSLNSPLLAWRDPVYIAAGLSGALALALLLFQPLLAIGALPRVGLLTGRRVHRWLGAGLTIFIVLHVAGLWVTSPPDVIDALLFRSPTSFSFWGVLAMWAVFGTALFASLRRILRIRPHIWVRVHSALALVIVGGTIAHALLIEGTMETISKVILCAYVGVTTLFALRKALRKPQKRQN